MPSDEAQDFWWLRQTCEYRGGVAMKESILHDHKNGQLNFYDAFTCIYQAEDSKNNYAGVDESFKDACVWDPVLHGSIGLYSQRSGDSNSIFFVCVSDFSQIASDIVRSIKSDLGSSTNVYDFCSSKEMWFLENVALRNRLRLVFQAARHLEISVPHKMDIFAHADQENSTLAVECCGTILDHIDCRIEHDQKTQKTISIVRHFKDCTDVTERQGPIPILLGPSLGFILLLPDKLNKFTFSTFNDTMPFVHNKAAIRTHLCPTLNVSESSNSNIQKIAAEQQNQTLIAMNDLIFDLSRQDVPIPAHVFDMISSIDEYGNFIFYAVKYSTSTPHMIYPRLLPAFTSSSPRHTNQLLSSTPSPLHTPPSDLTFPSKHEGISQEKQRLCETMCSTFKVDKNTLQPPVFDFSTQRMDQDGQNSQMFLEWSDHVVDLLQRMTRMRHIDTVFLDPHVCFDNYQYT
jgi:hypothetical protein